MRHGSTRVRFNMLNKRQFKILLLAASDIFKTDSEKPEIAVSQKNVIATRSEI